MNEIEQIKERLEKIENLLASLSYSDRFIFQKHLQLMEGRNISTGTGTGTKIGTATTNKIGFFNALPVVQQGAISNPNDQSGIYVQADVQSIVTAVKAIITTLKNLGLTA